VAANGKAKAKRVSPSGGGLGGGQNQSKFMYSNNHYNKHLNFYAQSNKQKMTKSEACMWKYVLSRGQMMGYKFQRQRPIDNYIVDFICLPLRLIIEVDGITHENEENIIRDKLRDINLVEHGYTVLRFSSWEVLNKVVDVSIIIGDWIKENADCPPPTPSKGGHQPIQPL